MKTTSNILVTLSALLLSVSIASCNDSIISDSKLPGAAKSFLAQYFPESAVSYVKKDTELTGTTYEVFLQDGTEIDFNSKGEWDNVDCKRTAVPSVLVPAPIAEYVQTNFPGQIIVKIDKEFYGYEIELGSGLELKFDKNGNLIIVDD